MDTEQLDTEEWALFNEAQNDVSRRHRSRARRLADEEPLVWHYTNAAGLLGILKHREVWLTHQQHLNDASEIKYGEQVAWDALGTFMQTPEQCWPGAEDHPYGWEDFLQEISRQVAPGGRFQRFADTAMACFSREPDLATQWLLYGDGGRGFALGFKLAFLAELATANPNVQVEEVCYDGDGQEDEAYEAIGLALLPYWRRFDSGEGWTDELALAALSTATLALTRAVPRWKNPGFRAEREVRLVEDCFRLERLKSVHLRMPLVEAVLRDRHKKGLDRYSVRSSGGRLVPYLEVPLAGPANEWLGAIRVGPCRDFQRDEAVVRLMLAQANGVKVEVTQSSAPIAPA